MHNITTEPNLLKRVDDLETAIKTSSFVELAKQQTQLESNSEAEKLEWELLSILQEKDSRIKITALLGLSIDQVDAKLAEFGEEDQEESAQSSSAAQQQAEDGSSVEHVFAANVMRNNSI